MAKAREKALLAFPGGGGPDYASPMRPRSRQLRALRLLSAFATFVVAWLVAPQAAWAASPAPVCDPRGAIMFAPPPQIQDLEQSLDVVAPCDGRAADPREATQVTRGHRAQIELSSSQEPATADAVVVPLAAPLARVRAPEAALARAPSGVRSDVERPPRS